MPTAWPQCGCEVCEGRPTKSVWSFSTGLKHMLVSVVGKREEEEEEFVAGNLCLFCGSVRSS